MTEREAHFELHKMFVDHPAFVCSGETRDNRSIILYYREYLGVPDNVPPSLGDWPVRCLPISSVRHGTIEEGRR